MLTTRIHDNISYDIIFETLKNHLIKAVVDKSWHAVRKESLKPSKFFRVKVNIRVLIRFDQKGDTCCQWTLLRKCSRSSTRIRYESTQKPTRAKNFPRATDWLVSSLYAHDSYRDTSVRIAFVGSRSQSCATHAKVMGNSRCFVEKRSKRNWKCFTTFWNFGIE